MLLKIGLMLIIVSAYWSIGEGEAFGLLRSERNDLALDRLSNKESEGLSLSDTEKGELQYYRLNKRLESVARYAASTGLGLVLLSPMMR